MSRQMADRRRADPAARPAVKIVEVGPRDGLQNEKSPVSLDDKTELIEGLISSGLKSIEIGSLVSPRWVPQMADSGGVAARFNDRKDLELPVLVPNMKGFEQARTSGVSTIAIFASATEAFSRANLNASRDESFGRMADVATAAREAGMRVRGYVSCAVHCPFEGWVQPSAAADVVALLVEQGCYEISLCDTTGAASAARARQMVKAASDVAPLEALAVHFHDTYGQALANTLASIELGISVVDSSVSGLGGCPYSPGATGNLATEDLVYMLEGMGVETGVDLGRLTAVGTRISATLNRTSDSRAARAIAARAQPSLAS